LAATVDAQGFLSLPQASQRAVVTQRISLTDVTITYHRPLVNGRKIWGGLVPYGKVWRMGADEATLFTTDKEVSIGGTSVAPGTYSLYLWPEEGSTKLIVNKQTGQWGTKYDQSQDLVRIDLVKQTLEKPVDQFTIVADKTMADGVLKMMWEKTQYSATIAVKQ
jgi:hypothetical protein